MGGSSVKATILALAMVCSGSALADDWSTTDKALLGAAVVLTVADWGQTLTIARNPTKYRELNPLLGEHPTVAEVNQHFIRGMILTGLLVYNFPSIRTPLLGTIVALEFKVVARNHFTIGIRASY